VLRDHVSETVNFLDPAAELIKPISKWKLTPGPRDLYLTTGDSRKMKAAAKAAFDWNIQKARRVTI
jgi:hypothetical protein